MSSEPAGTDDGAVPREQEFTVTGDNTFEFVPGPLTGISCPCCFRDVLLRDVIREGACNSCGAELELTLTARADESDR
ncbi:MAG: hypothetical protein ABEJ94_10365 [Halorientalis sp.]